MKQQISTPVIMATLAVVVVILGIVAWRVAVPAKVILPAGTHLSPPDYRTSAQGSGSGGMQLTSPNYSTSH